MLTKQVPAQDNHCSEFCWSIFCRVLWFCRAATTSSKRVLMLMHRG